MPNETAFELAACTVRFGAGATREVGADLAELAVRHALVFTDPNLRHLPPVATTLESLKSNRIPFTIYDRVRCEPTDESMLAAIAFTSASDCDAIVAVGGGSTIDTAKVANLYTSRPADFLDYVNQPIGKGKPVLGPLKPLIAIPTTGGTGSETTGTAVFDYKPLKCKTGISHRRLKPILGIVDPDNTRTQPPLIAASAGIDVLCHAAESFTALPYQKRERPERPSLRPAYQGSNPIGDLWCLEAIRLTASFLRRAAADPGDDEARSAMLLASTYAGIGFGNAGCHLPHAMSYPVSGLADAPIPHGISVIVNAPASFRYTAQACPERHLQVAQILGADIARAQSADAGNILADRILGLMQDLNLPLSLGSFGYTAADIPALVTGTLGQQRLTRLSPRSVTPEDLADLFATALIRR
jgi:hydroxyacid-oxoacid transhydrogenase